MDENRGKQARVPRRGVLKALALAPAAMAGCAAVPAKHQPADERSRPDPQQGSKPPPQERKEAAEAPPDTAVAAIRAFPLPAEAEPAFVFRAAAARPGNR